MTLRTVNGTLVGPVEVEADSDPDTNLPNVFQNFGNVVGDVTVSEGTVENGNGAGTVDEIQGSVLITGNGVVDNNSGGNITGAVTVGTAGAVTPDGGVLNIEGGDFGAPITINSGNVNVLVDLDTAADGVTINNVGGELAVGADTGGDAAILTTNVDLGAGSTTRVRATGTLDNDDGDAGTADTIVADAGLLVNEGTIVDQVRVEDGGTLQIANGTFSGGLDAQGGAIDTDR